jgi:PEGA domain
LAFSCATRAPAKNLKITTNPPGATVELDDKVVGATPFEQDFPSGYFQRPMTILQKRLEHPIHLRLTLPGYITQEILLTLGPKDWLDLHRRSHGEYWLFKSDEFHIDLVPLPPAPRAAATVAVRALLPSGPLPLLPPFPCASIPSLRRADQGFIRFSFAPLFGTQVGPRSPSNHKSHQAPARACSILLADHRPVTSSGHTYAEVCHENLFHQGHQKRWHCRPRRHR